jgi:hypothetical protein
MSLDGLVRVSFIEWFLLDDVCCLIQFYPVYPRRAGCSEDNLHPAKN